MSDVIHDGPAFNGMALSVDEVIVNLRDREIHHIKRCIDIIQADNTLKYVLTLWNTREMALVNASAAISQWILNTLYLETIKRHKGFHS